jgi:hypothetical protein
MAAPAAALVRASTVCLFTRLAYANFTAVVWVLGAVAGGCCLPVAVFVAVTVAVSCGEAKIVGGL